MKSENEIKALPLEELQKYATELRLITTKDKDYANAKALLTFITGLKKWKEPQTVTVENTADHPVPVDGKSIGVGESADVFPWQARALSRWLTPLEKAAGNVAALLLLFLLLGANVTQAQIQPYVLGSASQYNVIAVNGYYGATNLVAGNSNSITAATYYIAAVTNTVTIITNANWTINGGIPTNQVTYTTNTVVNYPGVVSMVNYDMANLYLGGALMAAGTGTNALATWDYSNDNVYWQTNALTQTLVLNGTTFVGTNTPLTLAAQGYYRLGSLALSPAGAAFTNIVVTVGRKPNRTGP